MRPASRHHRRIPPSGYTRAAPQPPGPRRLPYLAAALGSAVLVAGLTLPGDAPQRGSGALTPGTAAAETPPPVAARPSSVPATIAGQLAPSLLPRSRERKREAQAERRPEARAERPSRSARPPRASSPSRPSRPAKPSRKPIARPSAAAPPAATGWARKECARRFPRDAKRRDACTVVLARLGGR
ncbi:hypothetical protein [Actinomadura hibisca]|uniref:hypothetical protein n=1 Tax=Actinomadura hibisca TaxID=68565 RepID=UPI000ACC0070|nr:hypothetical protein [Actinomadura hibisca]